GPFPGERVGRAEGAREGPQRTSVQAHARLYGAVGLVELHGGGRHPHQRKAAPTGRRRHHRAALHARGLRKQPAAGDEFLAAGDRAGRLRAVRLETEHVVSPQAARGRHLPGPATHSWQSLARRRARAGRLARRPCRPHSEPTGQSRPLRRCPIWSLFRQLQGDAESMKQILLLSTVCLFISFWQLFASDPGTGDWPMWGGTPDRNMISLMKGIPTSWDIKTRKNVKWLAQLGSQSYGNPVGSGGQG